MASDFIFLPIVFRYPELLPISKSKAMIVPQILIFLTKGK